ncbi:MAG: leucine--tRNA ligase [Chloroflexi bacterium]|nr:leucine--tRNA ligase [Chloroflexota bacterium]
MVKTKAPKYQPHDLETKWQARWEATGLYRTTRDDDRPKHYALTMLPYPSGDLHIGHWYAMAPSDAKARFMRMNGYNVFFPIGFDAFGLPAENAAIKRGIHPKKWTMDNIARMRIQLRQMGAMWAWDHEAVSCLPEYYKWTQWFFIKLYEMGLAYKKFAPVDFCPKCNTTLAREQVWGEDRHCERCSTPVVKRELNQWFFKITAYADELLDGLDKIEWPERVKAMQRNWIGRSEGAQVTFRTERGDPLSVFTTRPDTLWGATFMVLAPEHPLVLELTTPEQRQQVDDYRRQAARQSEIERQATDKEKTGVFTGAYAINPVSGKRIPIWIADYVMMSYGTGAIMAVPAHDERDFEFAVKFGLPIVPVIQRPDGAAKSLVSPGSVRDMAGFAEWLTTNGIGYEQAPVGSLGDGLYVTLHGADQIERYIAQMRASILPGNWNEVVGSRFAFVFDDAVWDLDSVEAGECILARCKSIYPPVWRNRTVMEMLHSLPFYRDVLLHAEYGEMINSGEFTGTPGAEARSKVIKWLSEKGLGHAEVNYRLRDWLISRQRYWGAPIPMIYCEHCGTMPVPISDLPVLLPDDVDFMPTGESPLKYNEAFRNTTCPRCGGPAERETDTMDTFMCSSWYHYAYVSPYYKGDVPFDPLEGKYWLPVDQYTGGVEHATMHLMYTRFFTKAMRDMGLVDFDEPMLRLFTQGTILGEDNEKMSKSRGNVVNPDDYVSTLGADTVRAFLMFIGPWELGGSWSSTGIEGLHRFINRIWNVVLEKNDAPTEPAQDAEVAELRRCTHKTIKIVTDDIRAFKFNTALAALMQFNNYLVKAKESNVYQTEAWQEALRTLTLLIAPLTPHLAEELWEHLGGAYSVHQQAWPSYDPMLAADEVITLIVQVNGKVRARLQVPADIAEADAKALALANDNVKMYLADKSVHKLVYVPGKLVSIVI